jgi:hypothetical protein
MSINPVSSNPGETTDDIDQGVSTVVRPKKKGKRPVPLKPKTIAVRATGEWAAWLERGAKFCRTDVAKLLDVAAVEYLKEKGFNEEPPERVS